VTRRFPHLLVASVCLAKCDEEEEVPPHCICYISHPRNTRQWELPLYAYHPPLPHSKHEWEALSAHTHPPSHVSSNRGLSYGPPSLETHLGGLFCQHLPSNSCFEQRRARSRPSPLLVTFCSPACPPSLKMRVGGLFFTLCPAFRATKGSVHVQHAHHTLPHSRQELAGLFCPHLPSVSHFECWRALFIPTKPRLA